MRLKRPDKNKSFSVRARCDEKQLNAIKGKANLYTEGNLSEWIVYAALNYIPNKDEFESETKTPAKKQGKIKR